MTHTYLWQEIAFLNAGLAALFATEEGEGPPTLSSHITRTEFIALRATLSADRAEAVLDQFLTEKWLVSSGRGAGKDKVRIGARSVAEIGEVIRCYGVTEIPQIVTLR